VTPERFDQLLPQAGEGASGSDSLSRLRERAGVRAGA